MGFGIAVLRGFTLTSRSTDLAAQIGLLTTRQQALAWQVSDLDDNYEENLSALSEEAELGTSDDSTLSLDYEALEEEYDTMRDKLEIKEEAIEVEMRALETQYSAVTQEDEANDKLVETNIKGSFGTLGSSSSS